MPFVTPLVLFPPHPLFHTNGFQSRPDLFPAILLHFVISDRDHSLPLNPFSTNSTQSVSSRIVTQYFPKK